MIVYFLSLLLIVRIQQRREEWWQVKVFSVNALLDPGSSAGNFVNDNLLVSLIGVDINISVDGLRLPICSGLDNVCYNVSNKSYKLNVSS